jgi:CTP synthase (UTP-ammonia lyase)
MQYSARPSSPISIALVGDENASVVAHQAIPLALSRAAAALSVTVAPTWVHTSTIGRQGVASLEGFAGVWCVPASPYADMDAALAAIRFVRESRRPFLATCGGFQHALIEYARNVLGIADADHAETNPMATQPVIAQLACALVERNGALRLRPGSKLAATYGTDADRAEETYHCSYGLNPRFAAAFERDGDVRIGATDDAGEVRAVELASHPFFIATLFQPERSALLGRGHPLITAFVNAASAHASSVA